MLSKARTLTGYKLESLDGEIGTARDFYFDDRHWTVRYLVADTGEYTDGPPPTRDQEMALHRHYDRPGYLRDEAEGVDRLELSGEHPWRFLA